ncbi:MAG: inorganic phosphate transporter [Vulcanimicrobiota bacterium]
MEFVLHDSPLAMGTVVFLVVALIIALGFEFINGFHDTANAVATVIYTNSLKPTQAVVLSGVCNFLGVMLSGVGVAYSVVNLLPVDLLVDVGARGFAMVFAVLLSAVIWNLGTWYYGIPASSSHTLIGAIIGVGLVHSAHGVHWEKATQVGLSLLLSPLVGFMLAGGLLMLLKKFATNPELYEEPAKDAPPPGWIRAILIFTCSGVSLAHGSNDGQKGMGLIMLILIGLVPAGYAINLHCPDHQVAQVVQASSHFDQLVQAKFPDQAEPSLAEDVLRNYTSDQPVSAEVALAAAAQARDLHEQLNNSALTDLPRERRWKIRTEILLVSKVLKNLEHDERFSPAEQKSLRAYREDLKSMTEYVSDWVKVAVALALGLGTMVGWKRIVVTVGEKIGKTHLTYAQGAAAELVAMATIGIADISGLPVSTTHVLSSGVAGTMVANRSGVQPKTIKSILLAWVLTLPVSMALSAALFLLFGALVG